MTPERWQQIDRLLDAALDLEPSARAAFLDEACGGDDALRKEVEVLLAANARAEDYIEVPAAADAARVLADGRRRSVVGHQLGPYRVLSLLGEGGMGEVYLAEDSRLGRRVALKLLPKELARDADRRARFEREARAASALNHPSVCTIFEVGETEQGQNYIAMEHIQGETLRARLSRGPMALDEALAHAREVAQALAAAHDAGIVHRDIKPDNIMVRPDGHVKVLDFGIAKLLESFAEWPPVDTTAPPRLRQTGTGHVVGTAGYMSPEQAKGEYVDQRSDIFSFGVVFYEMLTGEMAFRRETVVETLRAIVGEEPADLSGSSRRVPTGVERVVRRCLEKEPERRYPSGRELAAELAELIESPRPSAGVSVTGRGVWFGWRRRWWLALAGVVLLAGAGAWLRAARPAPGNAAVAASDAPRAAMRSVPVTNLLGNESQPALSPDGRYLAFTWAGEASDNVDVYIKLVDGGTPVRLTSNPGADVGPAWSPDGQSIAFVRYSGKERAIFVIPAFGGPERKLFATNTTDADGKIDWSPDGQSVVYSDRSAPTQGCAIFRLSIDTLETQQLTSPPAQSIGDREPSYSPDGQMLAFLRQGAIESDDLYVMPAAGGEPRRLTFDNKLVMGLAWAPDGSSLVFSSPHGGSFSLWRISASGGEPSWVGLAAHTALYVAISRQGNRMVYGEGGDRGVIIWRLDRPAASGQSASRTKVLSTTSMDSGPRISPDGSKLAFASNRGGGNEIWVGESDGSNPQQVTKLAGTAFVPRWSPDGRSIAFQARLEGQDDIYVVGATGGVPRRLTDDPSDDEVPSWSRDGRFVYFASKRSGEYQVWKMPAEGGEAVQVTEHGGRSPFESPDGEYLYYSRTNNGVPGVWRIPVDGGEETLVLERPSAGNWGLEEEWAVGTTGIYFLKWRKESGCAVELYSLSTRRVTRVAAIEKDVNLWPSLSLSPDGRSLLYVQSEGRFIDFMLVEDFH